MATSNSRDAIEHSQVMGAQMLPAQAVNGVYPEDQAQTVLGTASQGPVTEDSAMEPERAELETRLHQGQRWNRRLECRLVSL